FQRRRISSAPVWRLSALAHQVCYSSPRATSSCNRTTAPNRAVFAPWQPTTPGARQPLWRPRGRADSLYCSHPPATNAGSRVCGRGADRPQCATMYHRPVIRKPGRTSCQERARPRWCTARRMGGGYKQLAYRCCGHQTPNFAHSPESSQDFMPTMTLHANGRVARARVPSGCIGLVKSIVVGFPRDISDIWSSQKKYKETTARDGRVVGKMIRSETSV
ncbi:hypothetical protein B0H14DRAFT_2681027, partial [Mycena olivaceomarginata]